MIVRNGLKTFAGNFVLVWKHLVYILIVFGITVSLFVLSLEPIIARLKESGWVAELYAFFEVIYTHPGEIAKTFGELATSLYGVLFDNFRLVWGNYALSLFLLLVLPNFLYGLGEYTLGVLTNARMSTLFSKNYSATLMSTLSRSARYSLWKMLFSLPFFVIMVALCFAYGLLINSYEVAGWLLLPIFVGVQLLVLAFRYVFFIGFLPEAVNSDTKLYRSFAEGLDNHTNGFMMKTLTVWGLFVMELGAVVFVCLFTIGAGLIIMIPSIVVVNVCCSFANYYGDRGENFYTGESTIVKPIKDYFD